MMPGNDSVVAFLHLSLHDNGAMSISGNLGDFHLAIGMLDSAKEAVSKRLGKPSTLEPHGVGLLIPHIDVVAPSNPIYPLVAVGDRK